MPSIEPSTLTSLEPTIPGPKQQPLPDSPLKSFFRNGFNLATPTDLHKSYQIISIYKDVDTLQICSSNTQKTAYVDGISNSEAALMELNSELNRSYGDIVSDNPTTIYTNILHPKVGLQMYAQISESSDINLY